MHAPSNPTPDSAGCSIPCSLPEPTPAGVLLHVAHFPPAASTRQARAFSAQWATIQQLPGAMDGPLTLLSLSPPAPPDEEEKLGGVVSGRNDRRGAIEDDRRSVRPGAS